MKMITFKRQFLVSVFMLLGCLAIQAADDLITQQITVTLNSAGTLPDRISSTKMYKITNLKIIGCINGTDLQMIRQMAKLTLTTLDLSEATIVSGGDHYYQAYSTTYNELGAEAFYGCSSLTNIEIPSSVTKIGVSAFQYCCNLTSIKIPSSVTWIGDYAFGECSSLTSLEIPSSVKMGTNAFSNTPKLTDVRCEIKDDFNSFLEKDRFYMGIDAGIKYFLNGQEITSIIIPSNVTKLGNYVFQNFRSLTSIEIPSSVTSIGNDAFYGCSGLKSVEIPSSVTKIKEYTFYGCSGLTSIVIPSSVTEIGKYAFKNCSGLTSVEIPSSVTRIEYNTFENCSGLKSIVIPSSVTWIDQEAFKNCSGLTSIVIPSSVTWIKTNAFSGCSNLTGIYVSWETPISIKNLGVFNNVNKQKCTLYVPKGTYQKYWLADGWGDFENIVEYDATGVDKVTTSSDAREVSRYSVNGQRLAAPTKGLNIVKYSDGSIKKLTVQ